MRDNACASFLEDLFSKRFWKAHINLFKGTFVWLNITISHHCCFIWGLNKRFHTYTLSIIFQLYSCSSAPDLLLAWKPFLNFMVFGIWSGWEFTQSSILGFFFWKSSSFMSRFLHFTLSSKKTHHLAPPVFHLESSLTRLSILLGTFYAFHITADDSVAKLSAPMWQGSSFF